jgi:HEAT repeat protein
MRAQTWLVVGISLALCGPAIGQPAPAPKGRAATKSAKPAKPVKVDVAPLVKALGSASSEEAVRAADELGTSPDPAAHEALLDALAWGLPPAVAVNAFLALGQHPAPPDVVALARYAGHHNPTVRGAALAALALYPDPAAKKLVVAGLHDETASVRAAAAAAAAKGHVREAIGPLFDLLARNEDAAAKALAQIADAELVRRIGDEFGKVPDPVLAQCLGGILKRQDFGPDTLRVEVVRALGKIQDAAALNALSDYVDATPKNPPRPSRDEAQKMVDARRGGGAK